MSWTVNEDSSSFHHVPVFDPECYVPVDAAEQVSAQIDDMFQKQSMGVNPQPMSLRRFKGGCDTALCGLNCTGSCGFPARLFYQLISNVVLCFGADSQIVFPPEQFQRLEQEYRASTTGRGQVESFRDICDRLLKRYRESSYIEVLAEVNRCCYCHYKIDQLPTCTDRDVVDLMIEEFLSLSRISVRSHPFGMERREFDYVYELSCNLYRSVDRNHDAGEPVLRVCEIAAIFCYCMWGQVAAAVRAVHYEDIDNCKVKVFQHVLKCGILKMSNFDSRSGRRRREGRVYHGLHVSDRFQTVQDLSQSSMYGTFISASTDRSVAAGFAKGQGVVLAFNLKRTSAEDLPAAFVDWISPHHEKEVLLPPLDEFRVSTSSTFTMERGCVMVDAQGTSYACRFENIIFPSTDPEEEKGTSDMDMKSIEPQIRVMQSDSRRQSRSLSHQSPEMSMTSLRSGSPEPSMSSQSLAPEEGIHRVQSAPHLSAPHVLSRRPQRRLSAKYSVKTRRDPRAFKRRSSRTLFGTSAIAEDQEIDRSLLKEDMMFGYRFDQPYHFKYPDWSPDECCAFIRSFGNYEYVAKIFEEKSICGFDFAEMTYDDLREFNVERFDRKKILRMRDLLNSWRKRLG